MGTTTASRLGAVLLTLLTAMTALVLVLTPTAATADTSDSSKPCRVKNPTQDTWFATGSGLALTRALAAAQPGDRLNVFGTCRGSFVVGVDLTIAGSRSLVTPTRLRDGDATAGRILATVPGVTVRLVRLRF